MKIVAVTACVAGLAHTYMAATGLKKAAKARNIEIHVETQGSMGIQNKIKQSDIDTADVVIFAVDTNVAHRDRFEKKPILTVKVAEAVKNADNVINKALELIKK
ncbi:PTS fructose transporter subunit IIB [Fonticella tunisiensis]|uniref:PTS system IIB component (Fru family) n=1 Tax=Fonticella tunisiensis TaxID=1096341 RepID=A0A4R7KVL1_9CLOT|nr:fructose PTS transporter subunit IIB [Fonticella tunisiensis]TDT62749.1 PTS system IIB component (Fru family) [Fonticella tunisiensis]